MPKTKFQSVIFTIIIAFLMVYAMICYNIALDKGGMSNEIFAIAFHELVIMLPVAFVLEMFICEKLSEKIAFRLVNPREDKMIFVLLIRSSVIVWLMCPMMSLVATILFKQPGNEIIAQWFQTTIMNFPMALGWQIFAAGPLGRFIFRSIFCRGEKAVTAPMEAN